MLKRTIIRLMTIGVIIILLYQKTAAAHMFATLLMMLEVIQSGIKQRNDRQAIMGQLMDKLNISFVLIVLVDQKILSPAVVAWVLGSMFILSGVDLLKGSLEKEAPDLNYSKNRNMMMIVNVFYIVFTFSIREEIDILYYNRMIYSGEALIVLITVYFVLKCFLSEEIRRIFKEA